MKKYTVTVKKNEDDYNAFFGVGQIDGDVVPDFETMNNDGSTVWSFQTSASVECALDQEDDVISYIVESICDACDEVFKFDENCSETNDGDLCAECTAEHNAELKQEIEYQTQGLA